MIRLLINSYWFVYIDYIFRLTRVCLIVMFYMCSVTAFALLRAEYYQDALYRDKWGLLEIIKVLDQKYQ